jgi:hypothetical protein
MSEPFDQPRSGEAPLLTLVSTSRAADAGYLALADLAQIATAMDADYRIVGGHMVTLLVAVSGVTGLAIRETLDADFGALPKVIGDPRLPAALHERGYRTPEAANRFVCRRRDEYGHLQLVIDILAPSYEGNLRAGQQHGELVVDEIPGLAFAMSRRPVVISIAVRLTGGGTLATRLVLPDLTSAICIKALAYRGRYADKDAVDLWRLLNVAYETGLRQAEWPTTVTGRAAADVLVRFFARRGAPGLRQVSVNRADQARMSAMILAVVGGAADNDR